MKHVFKIAMICTLLLFILWVVQTGIIKGAIGERSSAERDIPCCEGSLSCEEIDKKRLESFKAVEKTEKELKQAEAGLANCSSGDTDCINHYQLMIKLLERDLKYQVSEWIHWWNQEGLCCWWPNYNNDCESTPDYPPDLSYECQQKAFQYYEYMCIGVKHRVNKEDMDARCKKCMADCGSSAHIDICKQSCWDNFGKSAETYKTNEEYALNAGTRTAGEYQSMGCPGSLPFPRMPCPWTITPVSCPPPTAEAAPPSPPQPSPAPEPQPAPEPIPQPIPYPALYPIPIISPGPGPEPSPYPGPSPSPSPSPGPSPPAVSPVASPSKPSPSPIVTPMVTHKPSPSPTPTAKPSPTALAVTKKPTVSPVATGKPTLMPVKPTATKAPTATKKPTVTMKPAPTAYYKPPSQPMVTKRPTPPPYRPTPYKPAPTRHATR